MSRILFLWRFLILTTIRKVCPKTQMIVLKFYEKFVIFSPSRCIEKLLLSVYNDNVSRGPLGIMKFIEGSSLSGDILVRRHLNLSQVDRATSLLLSMNWDTHPEACMHSLNQILNYLFKLPLTPEREGEKMLTFSYW